jgi:hypothetical protein
MKTGSVLMFVGILILCSDSLGQKVNSTDLKGFEKCRIGKNLSVALDRLHKDGSPVVEQDGSLTFELRSEFLGLPVTFVEIGICDDGSRDCGWGSFVGLIVPLPLSEASKLVKKKTGIDFTKASRANANSGRYTLRPILAKNGEKKDESILFCDPGDL